MRNGWWAALLALAGSVQAAVPLRGTPLYVRDVGGSTGKLRVLVRRDAR